MDSLQLSSVSFQEDTFIKALGLSWRPTQDCFTFQFTERELSKVTKRTVLSIVSGIFDPLGLIAPVVISAKIFLQEMWFRKLEWDDTLPADLLDWWSSYFAGLVRLREISIPRWTMQCPETLGLGLHGFADESNRAFAAAVYLRVLNTMDQASITLLASKTKVAPIKTVSAPRLELCAAVLLSRLIRYVQASLGIEHAPIHC